MVRLVVALVALVVVAGGARGEEECVDSETWFATKPTKNCEWVAKKEDRCEKNPTIRAYTACAATCLGPPAVDSATWVAKDDASRTCDWVAEKAEKRCKKKGSDAAADACPATCDPACDFGESGDDDCEAHAKKRKCENADCCWTGDACVFDCDAADGGGGDLEGCDACVLQPKKRKCENDANCAWVDGACGPADACGSSGEDGDAEATDCAAITKKRKCKDEDACRWADGACYPDDDFDDGADGVTITWEYSPQAVSVTAADAPKITWTGNHNVVSFASEADYDACTGASAPLDDGSGSYALEAPAASGTAYYACGVYGHCGIGMKVAVTWTVEEEEYENPAYCGEDAYWSVVDGAVVRDAGGNPDGNGQPTTCRGVVAGTFFVNGVGALWGEGNGNSGADVDLGGITGWTGDVYVTALAGDDIGGLADLETVGGMLRIEDCPDFTSVSFPNLATVGAGFSVNENANLVSVDFPELTSVGGDVEIVRSPKIAALDGFTKLETCQYFAVTNNDALASIDGFAALETVANVQIAYNPKLLSINGFESLAEVVGYPDVANNGHVAINYNEKLESIDGLRALARINDYLGLVGNSVLAAVTGFASLAEVAGDLDIYNDGSTAPTDVSGLAALAEVGGSCEGNQDVLSAIPGCRV